MNSRTLRARLAAGIAALTLASCSGETPVAQQAEPSAAAEAPMAEPSPAEVATPVAEASAQPSAAAPSPTPSPSPAPSPTTTPVAAATLAAPVKVAAAAPPPAWARCVVCHSAEKGAPDKLGPNLHGVYGHKMGQGSYAFSDALKNAGLTLDDATLDKWLENPRALVPGNRMSFPGLKDPAKRAEIIAYLKQQR